MGAPGAGCRHGRRASVALYADDRQIWEVRYAEQIASQPTYTVRIYHVGAPGTLS